MGMKKVRKITEREIMEIVNTLLEQDDDKNVVRLSPEEVVQFFRDTQGEDFTKIPKFRNKKIIVTGDLNLRNMPVKTLGGISYIDGNLDITNTNIKSLVATQVKGRVSDWGTPVAKARIAAERAKEKADADARRDDNEWDIELYPDDKETIMANVLWEWLVNSGEVDVMTPEEKVELAEMEAKLKELNNRYESEEDSEVYDKIYDEISDLEEKIEELKEGKGDMYNLSPAGRYYSLYTFRVVGIDDVKYDNEWSVGTYDDAEKSALEYYENLVDDLGLEGLSEYIIEDNLDTDMVEEMMRESYEEWVRDSPESYFDESDFDNSDIEDRISELEDEVNEMESQLLDIEDSDSEEYDNLQNEIDEKNKQIEELEDSKITEPTDEMIDEKVNEIVDEEMRDPLAWLKGLGYGKETLKRYVDMGKVAEDIMRSDGIGGMNSYDSDYDTTEFNDETYVVMQTNG